MVLLLHMALIVIIHLPLFSWWLGWAGLGQEGSTHMCHLIVYVSPTGLLGLPHRMAGPLFKGAGF